MKVAIVYDRVNKWGGAERVLLALHEIFPDAPLYTSVYSEKDAKWARVFPEIRTSFLQKIPFVRGNHELVPFLMPLAFSLFNFDEYDLVISVTSEFAKNINVKNGRHVCYCLTPIRYLWSGYNEYFKNEILRTVTKPIVNYLRRVDINASRKPDLVIAISTAVQERIKKYYHRDSKIIFPPVFNLDLHSRNIYKSNLKNYFLIVSRLVGYKKVDLAIKVFNELGLPLIVVGTGREEKKLKLMSKKNIRFLGYVSDERLIYLYKYARALVFPQEEDFGIVAVEAQSFGVPVIAYGRGGILDIVKQGKTGVFFSKQITRELIHAIKKFDRMKFNSRIIRENTERFSVRRFRGKFLEAVDEGL